VALLTKLAKVAGRGNSQFHPACLEYLEFLEFALHTSEDNLVANALQNLAQN
jgi:hypothetical protein